MDKFKQPIRFLQEPYQGQELFRLQKKKKKDYEL